MCPPATIERPGIERLGLGLDAGGTATRWALADGAGAVLAEGQVDGITGLQMLGEAGRQAVQASLAQIALAAGAVVQRPGDRSRIAAVIGGFTGFDAGSDIGSAALGSAIAQAFALPADGVCVLSDYELSCRSVFEPGGGYLVIAGTGSVAAFVDEQGQVHRIGGRGGVIDDGGGAFWIACLALRQVWRAEDECPGAWRHSPLARRLFEQLGGSDWALTRDRVYGGQRGEVGRLALAVAAAAGDGDERALALLRRAGQQLARLAQVMSRRFGPRPVALTGRTPQLHPVIEQAMRDLLGADVALRRVDPQVHRTAAQAAARGPGGVLSPAEDAWPD